MLSQEFYPMGALISLKIALSLAEILATASELCSKTGPWKPCGRQCVSPTQPQIFPTSEPWGIHAKYSYDNSLGDIFTCPNDFDNAFGIQHRNLWIVIVLIYLHMAYVNLIVTGIVFDIRASGSHIDLMMAFAERRRWIISVFEQRSVINWVYWHNQQVGYLRFIPFEWEQRGLIVTVADQAAIISHL